MPALADQVMSLVGILKQDFGLDPIQSYRIKVQ
jgi:hypothetical protein